MPSTNVPVDVICKHTAKGEVIPIRIRVQDEDGEYQTYMIKSYRRVTGANGETVLPNGVIVTSMMQPYECKLKVL